MLSVIILHVFMWTLALVVLFATLFFLAISVVLGFCAIKELKKDPDEYFWHYPMMLAFSLVSGFVAFVSAQYLIAEVIPAIIEITFG